MPFLDDDAMLPAAGGDDDATDDTANTATADADAPADAPKEEPGVEVGNFRLTIDDPEVDTDDLEEGAETPQKEVATVTLFKVNSCKRRITVAYDAEQVTFELERQYRELNRTIQIDGFRRGKIPRAILEKRFGGEVSGEVKQNLVQTAVDKSVRHFEREVVGQPQMA
ncbi:MAG: trigger factor family protein, partial [Planctomycetota bacterium]